MRDIVATIQTDQYRLITRAARPAARDPGRPGHREDRRRPAPRLVAPLHASRRARPHAASSSSARTGLFMEYVSHVLPALGEHAVEQRAVSELVDGFERRPCGESAEVARLKADTRLAEVLARAVELRLRGHAEGAQPRLEGEYVRVRAREVGELLRGDARAGRARARRPRAVPDGTRAPLLRASTGGFGGGADPRLGGGREGAPRRRATWSRGRGPRLARGGAGAASCGRCSLSSAS